MAKVNYLSMFSSERIGENRLQKPDRTEATFPRVSTCRSSEGKAPASPAPLCRTKTVSSPLQTAAARDRRQRVGSKDGMMLLSERKSVDAPKPRQRTTTWPEVHYRMWLDISNLPVPSSYSHEQTLRKRTANWLDNGSPHRAGGAGERVVCSNATPMQQGISLLKDRSINKPLDKHMQSLAKQSVYLSSAPYGIVQPRTPHTVSRMGRNSLQAYTVHHPDIPDPLKSSQGTSVIPQWSQCPILQLKTHVRNPLPPRKSFSFLPRRVTSSLSVTAPDQSHLGVGRCSDISPPPSPPHLTPACRTVAYVSNNTQIHHSKYT